MTPPSDFDAQARKRTHQLVDALEKARGAELKAEVDALRAFVEARTQGLQQPSAIAATLEAFVGELAAAARAETEGELRAAHARAESTLADTRDQAAAEIKKAQAAQQAVAQQLDEVRQALARQLDEIRQQLLQAQTRAHEEAERAKVEIEAAQDANANLLADVEQARDELRAARAQASEEAGRSRVELAAAQAANTTLLAEVEQLREELRTAQAQASEDAGHARVELAAVQAAKATLFAEVEQAREQLRSAQAQANENARRATLEFDARLAKAKKEHEAVAQSLTKALTAAEFNAREALAERAQRGPAPAHVDLLDGVTSALQAMRLAASGKDVLGVVVEYLGVHFDRAAILIAGPDGLKCWLNRGFDNQAAMDGRVVRSAPVLQALETQKIVQIDGVDASPATGLGGDPISKGLALPIVAKDRVVAVAYAERLVNSSKDDFEVGRKLAEVLIEGASYRVGAKGQKRQDGASQDAALGRGGAPSSVSVSDTAVYAVKRQARRVRMRDVVNITLDGHASFLIDLSTRGAQVLSPTPLRPKQEVHIALVIGDRAIQCAGRVVWALFEQAKGATGALYRAGVEFIEVDAPSVEAFLAEMGVQHREYVLR